MGWRGNQEREERAAQQKQRPGQARQERSARAQGRLLQNWGERKKRVVAGESSDLVVLRMVDSREKEWPEGEWW